MRKVIVFLYISLMLLVTTACQKSRQDNTPEEGSKKPNILFAVADDASWKHFGAYGIGWVDTPAFDKVASSGILFMNAYTPNAKCSPSRSSILTGRNSWQLESAANHAPYFPEKFKTYVEALGDNNYWVGYTGKGWAPGNPGTVNGEERQLAGPAFNKHTTTPPTKRISDIDYVRNFEDFLENRPDDAPFSFWFGSKEPHRKYEYGSGIDKGGKQLDEIDEVPAFWPDVDSIRTDMLDYAYEIEYFDNQLQRMLTKLEEIGELENTIVVVTADNGMPFPRIKGQVYEYSNHLPLAIMWPNGIKNPGRVVEDFVSFIDFAPTFLELANVTQEDSKMQPITGTSLTDIFYSQKEGKINSKRDYVLVGKERHDVGRPGDQGYPVRGIVKGDFLYLNNFKTDLWPAGNPETGYLNADGGPTKTFILDMRRKKGDTTYWHQNFGKRQTEELYNIKKDPYNLNNLAEDQEFAAVKSDLKDEMTTKLREQSDPRILGNGAVFDNYLYSGRVRDFYNRYMNGEEIRTGWVQQSDFEEDFQE